MAVWYYLHHFYDTLRTGGGKFNTSNPKNFIELEEKRSRGLPGPAAYGAPKAPKIGGGRFNSGNSKSDVDWAIYRASKIPGPADGNPPKLPGPSGEVERSQFSLLHIES